MPEKMHASTASNLRPRQRTFTSCTECRRRKQKCNQAKDRPCSNCARRYPPPVCTYQGSSPGPDSMDRVSIQDGSRKDGSRSGQSHRGSVPSKPAVAPQYHDGHTETSISSGQNMYNTSHRHGSSSSSARHDGQCYSDSASIQKTTATSGGEYYPVTSAYYQADHVSYSTADTSQEYGYLATNDQQWLSSVDPDVYVGTGAAEYYYVDDTEHFKTNRHQ